MVKAFETRYYAWYDTIANKLLRPFGIGPDGQLQMLLDGKRRYTLLNNPSAYFKEARAHVLNGSNPNVASRPKLTRGATISYGWTLLHQAAKVGDKETVELLLKNKNLKPNMKTSEGWTALHAAVHSGQIEILKMLLDSKLFDINALTKGNQTPLDMAQKLKNMDAFVLLMKAGACPNIPDKNGKTVEDKATLQEKGILAHHNEFLKKQREEQARKEAEIKQKALDAELRKHLNTFFTAYKNPKTRDANLKEFFKTGADLIQKGANQSVSEKEDGDDLLDLAIWVNNKSYIDLVLSVPGYQINKPNEKGDYPLHTAVDHYPAIIPYLKSRGADDRLTNKAVETPHMRATRQGSDAIYYLEGKKPPIMPETFEKKKEASAGTIPEMTARSKAIIDSLKQK